MVMAARAPVLSSEAATRWRSLDAYGCPRGCYAWRGTVRMLLALRTGRGCPLVDEPRSESAGAAAAWESRRPNCPSDLRLVGVAAKAGRRPRERSRVLLALARGFGAVPFCAQIVRHRALGPRRPVVASSTVFALYQLPALHQRPLPRGAANQHLSQEQLNQAGQWSGRRSSGSHATGGWPWSCSSSKRTGSPTSRRRTSRASSTARRCWRSTACTTRGSPPRPRSRRF